MTSDFFKDLASRFKAAGITAEAVEDAKGRACALRFYMGDRAFEISPELVEGERLRLAIDAYEAEEPETLEDRLKHMIDVIKRADREI